MSRHKCDWSELSADVYWQTARSGSEISNHQERIIRRAKYDLGWWQCCLWSIRIMMFGGGNGIITLITYLWNINWYIHENEDSDCATWEEACEGSNDVPTGCEKNEREEDAEATPPHLNGKKKYTIHPIMSISSFTHIRSLWRRDFEIWFSTICCQPPVLSRYSLFMFSDTYFVCLH